MVSICISLFFYIWNKPDVSVKVSCSLFSLYAGRIFALMFLFPPFSLLECPSSHPQIPLAQLSPPSQLTCVFPQWKVILPVCSQLKKGVEACKGTIPLKSASAQTVLSFQEIKKGYRRTRNSGSQIGCSRIFLDIVQNGNSWASPHRFWLYRSEPPSSGIHDFISQSRMILGKMFPRPHFEKHWFEGRCLAYRDNDG